MKLGKQRHSSLGVSYTDLKYIAASVGYCLLVSRLFQNLLIDKQSTSHFLCLYLSRLKGLKRRDYQT